MPAFLIITAGYIATQTPRAQRDGWITLVPTTALILLNPYIDIPCTTTVTYVGLGPMSVTSELIEQTLIDRMTISAMNDPKWCGLFSWQWRLLLHQARAAEDNPPTASARAFSRNSDLPDLVVGHAIRWGLFKNDWPFKGLVEQAQLGLSIKGCAVHRPADNLVEWEIRRGDSTMLSRLLRFSAVPRDPPAGSVGLWVPPELKLEFGSGGYGLVSYWLVQSDGPAEGRVIVFDVSVQCSVADFGNLSTSQWPTFEIRSEYRP